MGAGHAWPCWLSGRSAPASAVTGLSGQCRSLVSYCLARASAPAPGDVARWAGETGHGVIGLCPGRGRGKRGSADGAARELARPVARLSDQVRLVPNAGGRAHGIPPCCLWPSRFPALVMWLLGPARSGWKAPKCVHTNCKKVHLRAEAVGLSHPRRFIHCQGPPGTILGNRNRHTVSWASRGRLRELLCWSSADAGSLRH